MSPKKAKISTIWTSGAWLEGITAPIEGTDREGGSRILAVITSFVQRLSMLLLSAIGSYDESYRGNAGGEHVRETPKEAAEPPKNFGETNVRVEED